MLLIIPKFYCLDAIQLKKKDKEIDLPPTMDDLYDKILKRKLELKSKK